MCIRDSIWSVVEASSSRAMQEIMFRVLNLSLIHISSFMLQPVVENAYSHWLKSCEEGGRILLRAWMQDKVLVLTVADNGKGMTPEELDAVQAKIVQSEQDVYKRQTLHSRGAISPAGCCSVRGRPPPPA